MVDFSTSEMHKAVRYPLWMVIPAQIIFGLFAVLFLLLFLFPKANPAVGDLTQSESLGLFLVFVTVNVWCIFFWMFYLMRLRRAKPPMPPAAAVEYVSTGATVNFAEYCDFDAMRVLARAAVLAKKKNIAISPVVFLFALIKEHRADFIFLRLLINKAEFEKSVEVIVNSQYTRTPEEHMCGVECDAVLTEALSRSAAHAGMYIVYSDLFSAVVASDKTIQRLFFDFGVKKEDIYNVAHWGEKYNKEYEVTPPFADNFRNVKGLADDWVYGYTPTLNAYGKEVAVRSVRSEEHMHILMRKEEAEEIETILARSGKNNVVLVGESGVGKTSIVQGFAQRVYLGTTQPSLQHKRVFELDVSLVLARARDSSTAIDLFEKLLTECERAGNIILVIDNIHNFVGPQHREEVGAIDISGILIPHLQSDRFQMIAVTDHASYHTNIERVPPLAVLFEKVQVRELNEEQTLTILEDITPKLERRHGLLISYYALWEAVSASGSFIQNIPFPEKAISLLTETLSFVASHPIAGKVVTQDHVTEIISKKTGIPLGRIEGDEKAKLLNMEELLHKRIISQHEAIVQIASALRRIRSGITERKRPIGTFLFLGPTGVGKTETAKALAAVYFGAEERMIRLDMTEYQSADSINRLIGNVDTQTEAQFANEVRANPFSIVVLDELEKAHPNILNLFLQVLDEGRLTDAFQKKVSFRNTIIIATSNAGSEFIREYVKSGQDTAVIQMKLFEHLLKGNTFKPEFMNRFDAIIVFKPLVQDEVKQVAALMLTDLKKRLEQKGYVFQLADDALEAIAQKGFDVDFGARAMRRFIQEHVENKIADKIIKGEYLEGDTITVIAADII